MEILTKIIGWAIVIVGILLAIAGLYTAFTHDPNGPLFESMTEEELEAWKKKHGKS